MNQADDVSLPLGELRVLGPQIDIKITERTKICNTVAKSNVLFFLPLSPFFRKQIFPLFSESSSEYDSEPKAQTVGPSDPRHGERKRRSFNDEAPGKGLRKRRHLRNAMNEKVPQNLNENVLENGNNKAANVGGPFFRRAYSGGRVARRKVRRDVDDEVDFGEGMGKDIFDRDPEEEGGDMLDSLELPNAKPFKDKGREGKVDVDDKVTDDGVNVDLSSEYDDPLQESGE